MSEKKIFGKDYEMNCNIMFLAQNTVKKEIRLMCLNCNPWVKCEEDDGRNDIIYLFGGVLKNEL